MCLASQAAVCASRQVPVARLVAYGTIGPDCQSAYGDTLPPFYLTLDEEEGRRVHEEAGKPVSHFPVTAATWRAVLVSQTVLDGLLTPLTSSIAKVRFDSGPGIIAFI